MKPTRWKSLRPANPERQYLALLSYLPLKRGWRIPWFLLHTYRITNQLKRSKGLVGYSLLAHPIEKRFWTLSVWEGERMLRAFVHADAHRRTMDLITPHMGKTAFFRWAIGGREIPPRWGDALKRQSEN